MNKVKSAVTHISTLLTLGLAVALIFAFAGKGKGQQSVESLGQEARHESQQRNDYCSQTARALHDACKAEVTDGSFKKKAVCINLADEKDRDACFDELDEERSQGAKLCRAQREERLAACELLGQNRYDPDIDPDKFDNDFSKLTRPNPYFPLTIGNRWEYRSENEVNSVEVLNRTKLIEDVTAVVVDDKVFKNGALAEATDDWFAQARNGDVWYLGEEVKDYESFDGDLPKLPELVKIDGSFKSGRNGDKGGLFFLAAPRVGRTYLEEFSLGNAEDVTQILSTTYKFGSNAELDRLAPQALMEHLCAAGDCIVTKNYSLLEPGIFARKYYARGIGLFLEVKPDTQEVLRLVNCNFNARCSNLP